MLCEFIAVFCSAKRKYLATISAGVICEHTDNHNFNNPCKFCSRHNYILPYYTSSHRVVVCIFNSPTKIKISCEIINNVNKITEV